MAQSCASSRNEIDPLSDQKIHQGNGVFQGAFHEDVQEEEGD